MGESERVAASSSEERYFPALGALFGPVSIPVAILFLGTVLRLKGSAVDPSVVVGHFLKYFAGIALYMILIRSQCVVRLSASGIRGSNGAVTTWKDITEVAACRSLLVAGFYVRSQNQRSVWIHRSVWTNPSFGRRVDELASSSALNRAIVTERALARVAQAQDRGDN